MGGNKRGENSRKNNRQNHDQAEDRALIFKEFAEDFLRAGSPSLGADKIQRFGGIFHLLHFYVSFTRGSK